MYRRRVVKYAKRTGNISETARVFKVTRQSIHRWIARYDDTLESLMDRSKRPHYHPNQHNEKEIRQIRSVWHHNKRLGLVLIYMKLKSNFGYRRSVTALYRLLRREGLILPPSKRRRRRPKPYQPILVPGERFQIDVKHVPKACLIARKRLYQYTAIDECTRWRYAEIYDELSAWNSSHFVKELRKRFPFEIGCIQTDNGAEFTSRLQGAKHPSAFETYLDEEGIRHKLIAVATPRHNCKVERSHRNDQERFYNDRTFYSLAYLRQEFSRYLRESNRMPLLAHCWKSASTTLRYYQEAV